MDRHIIHHVTGLISRKICSRKTDTACTQGKTGMVAYLGCVYTFRERERPENNRFRVPINFATDRFTFEKFLPPPPLLHPKRERERERKRERERDSEREREKRRERKGDREIGKESVAAARLEVLKLAMGRGARPSTLIHHRDI